MPHQKPMKWPLPEIVHPERTVCFQINVPNEIHYLAAFYGAIFLLSKPYAWGDDAAHTALEVGAVWREIFDRLIAGNCIIPAKPGSAGADGDDFMIRQNPDNPCLLESSLDGVEWCVFADISKCVTSSQPGAGSPQPQPGGGCQTYQASIPGNGAWLVPTIVSTGDTISLTNLSGAWYGGSITWYCPDGSVFFAGVCTGAQNFNGGSQIPASPIGRVIALIDGTYYDILPGPFTIPGGITNKQVTLLMNTDTPSTASGNVNLDVTVCNNQAASWSSYFDFAISDYSALMGANGFSFVPGTGLNGIFSSGTQNSFVFFQFLATGVQINNMTIHYDCTGHGGGSQILAFYDNAGYFGTPTVPTTGTNLIFGQVENATADAPGVQVGSGSDPGPVNLRNLLITGVGTKPAGWP